MALYTAGYDHAIGRSEPVRTILDAIGGTPLIEIEGIWAKLEFLNPSGSIKARIARWMVERAEKEGLLQPGGTIVEASSGNTGNALSMVAAVKGYRMLVVMPRGLSRERAAISRAFGAEVLEVGDFHVNEALETARTTRDWRFPSTSCSGPRWTGSWSSRSRSPMPSARATPSCVAGQAAGPLLSQAIRVGVERRGEPGLARAGDPRAAACWPGSRRARLRGRYGRHPDRRRAGVSGSEPSRQADSHRA